MIRAFLPAMQKRNEGHIVATSSVAAFTCAANIVPYAATKYGVTGKTIIINLKLNFTHNMPITCTFIYYIMIR